MLNEQNISLAHYQYNQALAKLKTNPEFKIFIWFPHSMADIVDEQQLAFISDIRNNPRDVK